MQPLRRMETCLEATPVHFMTRQVHCGMVHIRVVAQALIIAV